MWVSRSMQMMISMQREVVTTGISILNGLLTLKEVNSQRVILSLTVNVFFATMSSTMLSVGVVARDKANIQQYSHVSIANLDVRFG
jgi:hypothetical protein